MWRKLNYRNYFIIFISIGIIISVIYYSIRVIPLRRINYAEKLVDISSVAYDICYNEVDPSANYYVAKSFSDSDIKAVTDADEQTYEYKDLDVEYHEDPQVIANSQGMPFGSMVVIDKNGNQIVLTNPNIRGSPIYYDPTNIRYSMSNYVPNYKDSLYLRSDETPYTNIPLVSAAPRDFCQKYKNDPVALNRMCEKTAGKLGCNAMSCCVLLGEDKCVYGGPNGAYFNLDYKDVFSKNSDYYYYMGKQYGAGATI